MIFGKEPNEIYEPIAPVLRATRCSEVFSKAIIRQQLLMPASVELDDFDSGFGEKQNLSFFQLHFRPAETADCERGKSFVA